MAAIDCHCVREVVALMDVGTKRPADNTTHDVLEPQCDVAS